MREIKFRAWTGYSIVYPDLIALDEDRGMAAYRGYDGVESEENEILMQYTGLHDKNGKEIYEGDIVRCDQMAPAVVEWDNDRSWYKFGGMIAGDHVWPIEVIGNVWENPELLEKK